MICLCTLVSALLYENIRIGFHPDVVENLHEEELSKILSAITPICRLSAGHLNKAMYSALRLILVLCLPFGKAFCNNKITLAFLCLPCINSFEIIGLSTARSFRSSKTIILPSYGTISRVVQLSQNFAVSINP